MDHSLVSIISRAGSVSLQELKARTGGRARQMAEELASLLKDDMIALYPRESGVTQFAKTDYHVGRKMQHRDLADRLERILNSEEAAGVAAAPSRRALR